MQINLEHKTELLMPAGSLEKLKIALMYGADAVYVGTPDLSLRTKAEFTLEEIAAGVKYAHSLQKRVYLTLNLFTHNKDIPKLAEFIQVINQVQPDGLIISDPGLIQYVKQHAPNIPIHISTQANVCSWLTVKFWQELGAELVVLAREVSFAELTEIRKKCPDIKLETFIHGAMCMTYSGRCLLSNYLSERGANQGNCANSCRWDYKVKMRLKDNTVDEFTLNESNQELFEFLLEEGCRPGELMPIVEDDMGSYILNSKDLCLMPMLGEYLKLGVDSLKVEGRNKSAYYVALVAKTYREAIDAWYANPEQWDYQEYLAQLHTVPNRGFSLAFHDGRLTNHSHNYVNTNSIGSYEYAGIITEINDLGLVMLVKNRLNAADVLEIILPNQANVLVRLYEYIQYPSKQTTSHLSAGQETAMLIPWEVFNYAKPKLLKQIIKPCTIVRKLKQLTPVQKDRLEYDKVAEKIELATGVEQINQHKLQELKTSLATQKRQPNQEQQAKAKDNLQACCAKGCNGCLVFWHEPKYEKARSLLASKQQGALLNKAEINSVK